MDRKLRVVQYGCGKMSVHFIRYLVEHGAELVGGIDVDPAVVGKDLGEIAGIEPLGVRVTAVADADAMLSATRPDVAVIATMSTMADIQDAMSRCARHGVNAISTAEEAVFPRNSSPQITRELDALARQHGVTLTGSGYPDMFWGTLVATLAASMHTITKITGSSSYNVEHYGIALARGHGAGLSTAQFEAEIAMHNDLPAAEQLRLIQSGQIAPSYMWNQNGWLCARLGLTPVSQTQRCVPTTHTADLYSSTLAMSIPAGQPTGMSAIVTTTTAEGIELETQCIGKVYAPDEFDRNDWTFHGEPETTINVNRPATPELTCSTLISRLPALVDARPGYVTTDELAPPVYLLRPLHTYVTTR